MVQGGLFVRGRRITGQSSGRKTDLCGKGKVRYVHDIWALSRIREGWRYGPARDDDARETPCLVPYEALPDSEKEYDRRTAMETIRLMIRLGCRIQKA